MHTRKCGPRSRNRSGSSCLPVVLTCICGTLVAIGAAILCDALFTLVEGKPLPSTRILPIGLCLVFAGLMPIVILICCNVVTRRRRGRS